MKLNKLLSSALLIACASGANANSIAIYDDTFSLFDGATQLAAGTYDARWGTYSGGVFTPFLGAAANDSNTGYVDIASPELSVSLSQGDNLTVASGSSVVLVITNDAFGSTYASDTKEIILSDPSWVAPTFALVGQPDKNVGFTSNTTALKGLYSYNAGNQVLTFTAVPEPSSFAALAGFAVLGLAASRRRRA